MIGRVYTSVGIPFKTVSLGTKKSSNNRQNTPSVIKKRIV